MVRAAATVAMGLGVLLSCLGGCHAAKVTLVEVMGAGSEAVGCTQGGCKYTAFRIPGLVAAGNNTLIAFAEGRKFSCGDFGSGKGKGQHDMVTSRSTGVPPGLGQPERAACCGAAAALLPPADSVQPGFTTTMCACRWRTVMGAAHQHPRRPLIRAMESYRRRVFARRRQRSLGPDAALGFSHRDHLAVLQWARQRGRRLRQWALLDLVDAIHR